jgi:uncharacterized tellurite resistance protein B-like protein
MNNENNTTRQSIDAILARVQSLKPSGKLRSKEEISLAAAIVLMEVASSDHVIDKFERTVIHNGLKGLFKLSDEVASGLMQQAKARLGSMRSSSSEAELLRDSLDLNSKRAIAQVIDNLIRCNGVVDGIEVYLRKRFREILGIPEEVLNHFD